jgi:hypothetical protein
MKKFGFLVGVFIAGISMHARSETWCGSSTPPELCKQRDTGGYALAAHAKLSAEENQRIKATFGCVVKDNRCVVTASLGGVTNDFIAAARSLFLNDVTVVISGKCYSACTIGADRLLSAGKKKAEAHQGTVEDVVCITPRASFAFHEGFDFVDTKKGFVRGDDISVHVFFVTSDLKAWVDKQGPLPHTQDIKQFLKMQKKEARAIWPPCR